MTCEEWAAEFLRKHSRCPTRQETWDASAEERQEQIALKFFGSDRDYVRALDFSSEEKKD